MKVQFLSIRNLKCYRDETILLSKNINLLVGTNNSGKSTIIKSLLNLQYNSFDQKDIRCGEFCSEIMTNLTDISENEYYKYFYREEMYNNYNVSSGITTVSQFNQNRTEEYNFVDSSHITLTRNIKKKSQSPEPQLIKFHRFSDSENKNSFIYPFLAKRKTDYYDTAINQDQVFKISDSLRNLAAKIQKISNPSHPMNDEFNRLCVKIMGFKIGVVATDQNSGTGIEAGIYVDTTSSISIRSMGDGVANIAGFITILLTENDKLFLIEELENDIHPQALKSLLDLIVEKSSTNQFVISTHSHIVLKHLGAVPDSKIFYVDWQPKMQVGKTIQNVPTSTIAEVENKPENRIKILEKLGYDFYDYELYSSYLILEESTAERVIRDFIIPNIVPGLYNKIKTIASRGVHDLVLRVEDFNRLFVFIHTNPIYFKRAWVIADGDEQGRNCINTLQTKFSKWPKDHFTTFKKENFEEYYPSRFQKEVGEVLLIKHGKKQQEAKTALLNKVMDWALKNREEAIAEFNSSAEDVISLLKKISLNIHNKDANRSRSQITKQTK